MPCLAVAASAASKTALNQILVMRLPLRIFNCRINKSFSLLPGAKPWKRCRFEANTKFFFNLFLWGKRLKAAAVHAPIREPPRPCRDRSPSVHSLSVPYSAAIAQNRTITFRYFTWNTRHERVFRRNGERYEASPWALLLDSENYYLLAWEGGRMKHFRVDKMLDIAITDTQRDGGAVFETLNMAAYTDAHFGMFSGKSSRVKLRFDESMAGVAIDFFGHDVMMVRQDESHFTVTVDAAVNEQFFGWLFGLGDRVQLLGPPEAVEAMRRHMASVAALYGTDSE